MKRQHMIRRNSAARTTRHHDDVHRYFMNRPDDLLEMNIIDGDGWERLSPFLGLPAPAAPFPHLNQRGLADRHPKG